jgi:hypothetical protein
MPADEPSQVISTLLDELRKHLPEAERTRLAEFEGRAGAASNDGKAEWRRAFACARWATRLAASESDSTVMSGLKRAVEAVREVEKAVGGELTDLLELPFGWSVSPSFEVEITWVFEAVHAAQDVAATRGWDAVPWEDLLETVVQVPG